MRIEEKRDERAQFSQSGLISKLDQTFDRSFEAPVVVEKKPEPVAPRPNRRLCLDVRI